MLGRTAFVNRQASLGPLFRPRDEVGSQCIAFPVWHDMVEMVVRFDRIRLMMGSPQGLSQFYHMKDIGEEAAKAADPFEYQSRHFSCVGYAGERYGPTLVWRVE